MKICAHCNTGNPDEARFCRECNASIGAAPVLDSDDVLNASIRETVRREKRNQSIVIALSALYATIDLVLFILSLSRLPLIGSILICLVIPALSFILILRPETGFHMQMEHILANAQDAEPSEDYLIRLRVVGVLFAIGCLFLMVYLLTMPLL